MKLPMRGTIIRQLPTGGAGKEERAFVRELSDSLAQTIRPRVVLDVSAVRRIDAAFLHLLLRCLEEALKRNGDVRLAGAPEEARQALEAMGVQRLFRFFATIAEAVESFRSPGAFAAPVAVMPDNASRPSARAA